MSFRELRNFTEIMRVLGYPRLISIENFRSPNFPLMAEVLQWLVQRCDEAIELPMEIDTEQDRATFVTTAALLVALKVNVKLNTKKLYMSDGHAVQELLKISSLLFSAAKTSKSEATKDSAQSTNWQAVINEAKLTALKKSRQLASEITQKGANLYDLLAKELAMRERRVFVLSRQLEMPEVERCLREEIRTVEKEIENTNFKIDNVASDEANLDAKLDKKRAELERNQKRLQALKSVRPAFMDEFEKLEEELAHVYNLYVVKFRCLVFLEQQLEDVEKSELIQKQEHEEHVRKIVEAMREEQLITNDSGSANEEDTSLDEMGREVVGTASVERRARRPNLNTTTAKRSATGRVRPFGSVLSGEKEESIDSDFELEADDGSDLDSEDEMELLNLTAGNEEKQQKGNSAGGPRQQSKAVTNEGSDDDF